MPDTRKSPVLPLAVAAVAAVALVIALFGMLGDDDEPAAIIHRTGQSQPPSSDDPLAQLARREPEDPMATGKVDAPVVMVAYSEFQCPFCGKFARDTVPTLAKKYIENGTLRIEWRDFPYLGPESTTAALAGRAAAAQDEFWRFHDAMYADQLPPNSGKLDEEYVEDIAERLGLDVKKFRDDMASDRVRKLVDNDFREGQQIGISGTPSFIINGTPVVGAQPTPVFEQVIDEAAAEAS